MRKQEEIIEQDGPELVDLVSIFQDFFRIVRGKWLRLLAIALLMGGLLTGWRYIAYVPHYTAAATYAITTDPSGSSNVYQNNSITKQIVETAPYVLGSDMFHRRVAETLEVSSVPGTIHANVMENTNFLIISVSDTDAQSAYRTLTAVQAVFPDVSERIMGKFYMEPMDETGVPTTPDRPRSVLADFLQGALVGLLAGFVLIAISAATNGTVRREEDCIRRINTKCLAVVPRIHQKVRSQNTEQHLSILRKNADPELVEAFRNLRNKVERRTAKKGCRTLLITSALPGEGKSTVAANLALSLAQAGKRVVLVDCDLRNPTDDLILAVPEGCGLSDYLIDHVPLSQCTTEGKDICSYPIPLRFIRGGKPLGDCSAHLHSPALQQLITLLREQTDYLILDTPPAGLLTDASILSQYADSILFVVKADFAKVDKILESMEHVTEGGCEMLGCVLNDDH